MAAPIHRRTVSLPNDFRFHEEVKPLIKKTSALQINIFRPITAPKPLINSAEFEAGLRNECHDFIKNKELDRALELANQMQNPAWKNIILRLICYKFIEENRFKEAIDLAKRLNGSIDLIIYAICNQFIDAKRDKEAIELSALIENEHTKQALLFAIQGIPQT